MNHLISIIIPIYNSEKFILRCLDSLINQTYNNIEIICVDDWSKDNSLGLINDYKGKDNRIVIISQKNQWAGIARNNWIKIANWDFITFVDSDDALELDAIEEMVKCLDEDTDIIISWIKIINNVKNTIKLYIPQKKDWIWNELKFTATVFKLYRRKLIEDNNIKFGECKIHEDVIFSINAFSATDKINILSKSWYINYQACNPNSLSMSMGKYILKDDMISSLLNNLMKILLKYKKYNIKTMRFFLSKTLIQDVLFFKAWNDLTDIYITNYKFIERHLWKIWFYRQNWASFPINFVINFFVFCTKIRVIGVFLRLKRKFLDK